MRTFLTSGGIEYPSGYWMAPDANIASHRLEPSSEGFWRSEAPPSMADVNPYGETFFRIPLPSSGHSFWDLLPPDTRTRQQYLADQKKWAKRDRRLKWQRKLRRLNPFHYRIQHVDDICSGEDCGCGYE